MSKQLAGKFAAVTGASRGSAFEVCRRLAAEGAQVAMLARGEERLRKAAAEIGDGAVPVVADITDPDSVRRAFDEIGERFGALDFLVNSAAIGYAAAIETATDQELTQPVLTNLLGPMLTARSAVPLLRGREGATIINVSSESAHDPFPYLLPYASTKAGLETFSEGLLQELKPEGIRVTLLCSGFTRGTGFAESGFSSGWDEEKRAEAYEVWQQRGYMAKVAGAQPQSPERIADAVVFVCTRPPDTMTDVIHVRAFS